jgi:uncharacterized DUF497 family protein
MAEFQWDDANIDHIGQHGVNPEEAEEAYLDPYRRGVPVHPHPNEDRWGVLGRTDAGRSLFLVFTKRAGNIRIISARDATKAEKQQYRKK